MNRTIVLFAALAALNGLKGRTTQGAESTGDIPVDAKYACPMETHPDEADPSKQGPYYSSEPGKCPLCGMTLKPLDELEWGRARRAAGDADVAYTCPQHQQVFSKRSGECPRCGHHLMPFKVMYTCPDPEHAGVIRTQAGNCPLCGRGLAAFRGVWLDESMADQNLPPAPGLAEAAAYRCPVHPLVHSDKPGFCTICARPLESSGSGESGESNAADTADSKPTEIHGGYVCPMHPEQVHSAEPGACPICGMQLVHAATFPWPKQAPEHVAAQVDYLAEHYLELQSLLASDRFVDVARQALAIVAASDELAKHIAGPGVAKSDRLGSTTERLRAAALKMRGKDLEQDRATLVELSAAFEALIDVARPSKDRWPKLYIYHCPMSKGDWVQSSPEKRNPYYGFKMLTCGEL